ncbi:MAG: hypothetical protein V3R68_06565 [Gammaproteobacteria bacterium]
MRPNEVTKYSWGARMGALEGCAQDAYMETYTDVLILRSQDAKEQCVGGRVMQEQLPSGLLILSLRFHKKAVTLAHSAHGSC